MRDVASIPVNKEPSPLKLVAVTTPVATIPLLAVITPTESTLVTSSYVRVPPIETLPLKVDIPDTVIPSGKFGAPLPAAFSILSVYTVSTVSYTHLTLPTICSV